MQVVNGSLNKLDKFNLTCLIMLYPLKQITGFLFHFLMITLPHNAGYQNFVKFVKIG